MNQAIVRFLSFLIIFSFHPRSNAATGGELKAAFEKFYDPSGEQFYIPVKNLTLESPSLKLFLDSGIIYLFAPATIDSQKIYFGGYFVGQGRFQFQPPVAMEREQLRRFFDTDSLDRTFQKAEIFCNDSNLNLILNHAPGIPVAELSGINKEIKNSHENLTRYDYRYFDFQTFKNLIEKWPEPYLMVNADLNKGGRVVYRFDPAEREEVGLYKNYSELAYQFFELVCSYYSLISPDYKNINGENKKEITGHYYDIDAYINDRGKYRGKTNYTFETNRGGTRLLVFNLHTELNVDSIIDSDGNRVEFVRHKKNASWIKQFNELYLFLNSPLIAGDTLKFTFFYEGDIAERDLGEFFVTAGAEWYPRYGFRQRTSFVINFKTPPGFDFVSTGSKTSETVAHDTAITRWQLDTPASNVSFAIGNMKSWEFREENFPVVEVHFSKDFHRQAEILMLKEMKEDDDISIVPMGKDMEKQVGNDVAGALKLFTHQFGQCESEKIIVTEVLVPHFESFPGLLHLGFSTWVNTDPWGYDRLFRAHETAHQWWGSNVGYETYHDQWLSEGFAEYSALMYLQAVSGNDKFLEKLGQYRDNIFSVRKFIFSSGEESGPIALGWRTSSTKTRGDYGLIIYEKGALVLHMLRNLLIDLKTMNEDLFFEMMKEYYAAFKGKEATTEDFRKITEQYTGIEMDWFFNQWVYGTELPEYEFKYVLEKADDGYYYANCTITQSNVSAGFKMYMPVEIEFPAGKAYIRLLIDKPVYEFKLPPLAEKPKKIRLNPFESVLAKVKQ